MNWLQKFMYGRYGVDHLAIALLLLSIPISLIATVINLPYLSLFTYVPLIICYFRILSKNLVKRRQENNKFLTLWNPIKNWFSKKTIRLKGIRTHKYYKCPKCSKTLRVPRGKGKIRITCPTCKNEFSKKT